MLLSNSYRKYTLTVFLILIQSFIIHTNAGDDEEDIQQQLGIVVPLVGQANQQVDLQGVWILATYTLFIHLIEAFYLYRPILNPQRGPKYINQTTGTEFKVLFGLAFTPLLSKILYCIAFRWLNNVHNYPINKAHYTWPMLWLNFIWDVAINGVEIHYLVVGVHLSGSAFYIIIILVAFLGLIDIFNIVQWFFSQ
jgi:hypothetical protein